MIENLVGKRPYPLSFNIDMAANKGLIVDGQFTKKYFEIQRIYKKVFEEYISDILSLKKYDELITNNELKFGMCPEERKDYYQKSSTLNLNYFYIKNNIHIEKLELEDLDTIDFNSDNEEVILEIVKRTYKDIIKIDTLNNRKVEGRFKTQFFEYFNTPNTMFYNDVLILVIKEGPANNGLSGEEFRKNFALKHQYIDKLIQEMNDEFKNKLDCEIEICHLAR